MEWCGLLWCFYQLFGLSFWRHPFTADHPLLSYISPNLMKKRTHLAFILNGLIMTLIDLTNGMSLGAGLSVWLNNGRQGETFLKLIIINPPMGYKRFIFWFWESPITGWHALQGQKTLSFSFRLICIYYSPNLLNASLVDFI